MIAALSGDRQQDALQLAGRVQAIHTFEIDLNRAEVGFIPARFELRPRERGLALGIPADVDAAAVNVVGNVLQPGIVAQDQREVPEGILDLAVLVDVKAVLPVCVFFRSLFRSGSGVSIQIAEFLHCLCPALLRQLALGRLVLRGILLHQLHGRCFIANQRSVRG